MRSRSASDLWKRTIELSLGIGKATSFKGPVGTP